MKTGAFIVPTGIGASIGGFAGDAGKWARRLSQKCKLIVNPNVVNAACFSAINDKMLYVEGYSLDKFFQGKCSLIEAESNKIGVIFDKEIPQDVLNVHINTINAVKTVYDIDIPFYELTDENVGVEFFVDKSGASMGNIKNLKTLKIAAEKLLNKGANAIALVCRFPEEQGDNYAQGIGVDPVGGVEAILSHYISKEFGIPCAHAPAFDDYTIHSEIVDSRCSAEYITPTFLPCILLGLNNAPLIQAAKTGLTIDDLDFLALPYNALGGIPAIEASERGVPIYAVRENVSVLNVTPEIFSINCHVIGTYQELIDII